MRKAFEIITGLLIAYGAIGLILLFATGGKVNILPGPLVDRPTESVPRGYSND
jgi:hypothetical protein